MIALILGIVGTLLLWMDSLTTTTVWGGEHTSKYPIIKYLGYLASIVSFVLQILALH